jgi:hypothetical protein
VKIFPMFSHQGETISFIILELGTFVIFVVEIKDGRSVKGVVIYPTSVFRLVL